MRAYPGLDVRRPVRAGDAARRPGSTRAPYLWALAGALLLAWFAVFNGFPLIYEDTVAYLQRPARILAKYGIGSEWDYVRLDAKFENTGDRAGSQAWLAGRSVYYGGANAIIAAVGSSWAIVAIQAYLVALAIAIPWFRMGGRAPSYLVAVAIVAFATSAAVFVGTLLPDILVAVAGLTVATTIILWNRLSRLDLFALTALTTYAGLSHDSILLFLAVVLALCGVALALGGFRRQYRRLAPLGVACAIGVGGAIMFSAVASAATGEAPMRLPHLTAKLATSAEGRDFLASRCAEERFVVCSYQPQVRRAGWVAFLFSRDARTGVFSLASPPMKRALSEEQIPFALAMVTHDPVGVARLQLQSSLSLLVNFSLDDLRIGEKARFLRRNISPELYGEVADTRTFTTAPGPLDVISRMTFVTVVAALFVLAIFWWRASRRRSIDVIDGMAASLVAVVVMNAVLCASVAGVYDRFQARIVWLIPLAALIVLFRAAKAFDLSAAAVDAKR